MTRHRARSFQLESLEGKQLLSTLHPAHHARSKPAPLVLNGTLKELEGQNVSGYSGELKSLGQVVANVDPQTGNPSATKIVVNLEHVHYVDSAGLGALIEMHRKTAAKGGRLVLSNLGPNLKRALEIARLLPIFETCTTEAAAMAAF